MPGPIAQFYSEEAIRQRAFSALEQEFGCIHPEEEFGSLLATALALTQQESPGLRLDRQYQQALERVIDQTWEADHQQWEESDPDSVVRAQAIPSYDFDSIQHRERLDIIEKQRALLREMYENKSDEAYVDRAEIRDSLSVLSQLEEFIRRGESVSIEDLTSYEWDPEDAWNYQGGGRVYLGDTQQRLEATGYQFLESTEEYNRQWALEFLLRRTGGFHADREEQLATEIKELARQYQMKFPQETLRSAYQHAAETLITQARAQQ